MAQHPDPPAPPGPGAAFYQALLERHTDVLLVLGSDGTIRYATPSAAALFGRGPVTGRRLPDLVGDDSAGQVAGDVARLLGPAPPGSGPEELTWLVTDAGGRPAHLQVSCADLRENTAVGGVVLTLRNTTAQREAEEELRHLAYHDQLTGLPNRALFGARAALATARAARSGLTAAIMFVDLDDFKRVNDSLGHRAGDEVLAIAAARLDAAVRDGDTVGRLGGDEFAVLLEDLNGPAAAAPFADRAVRALGAPFAVDGGTITIGASIGLATTSDAADPAGLLRCADLALYAAKAAGKGTWLAYDPATTARMPPVRDPRDWDQVTAMGFPGARLDKVPRRAPGTPARRPGPAGGQQPPRPAPPRA